LALELDMAEREAERSASSIARSLAAPTCKEEEKRGFPDDVMKRELAKRQNDMNQGPDTETRSVCGSLGLSIERMWLVLLLVGTAAGQVTSRVSVDSTGVQGNDVSNYPSVSADGQYVVFASAASNLVPGDTNGAVDIFVHDRQSGTTERISVDSAGTQANGDSDAPVISADGRYVAFESEATNLVPGDTNGAGDIFVHDRQSGTTERISIDSAGEQENNDSYFPAISGDGRYVALVSLASNLVPGDTNGTWDVFVRDRAYSPFTSLCNPSADGVLACPCANPPSALGRGCDNSSGTGGASLSGSGIAYLSMDSLVFVTSGEKPTATSIVLQGDSLVAGGIVIGQGVRCAGGSLKRLYTKTASGGSITAPNFGAGDQAVSVRSASLGDAISPGQSRWYLVYYRNPVVLGGCPVSSTFNATQTGRVDRIP
jgi:hypothetical protein